ncbi:BTAD domain-containing putative transcriptional regulator [Mycolicibacterium sp.]|uniref:BTAD domain-containing putative transcriptional regulator n=1 Tax=Mycolicibacterium sp. TaxID=2320850 RepID=UPI001A1B1DC3|nr:BTAD domain-containing putative transcriptional regulator [Mycolicibacterium sp.]MBJ7336686.1 AAA family ATPase [Mycolicibacterium sp.]
MEYRLLGSLAVFRDGEGLPLGGLRQRAVLAALLLAGDRAVDADRLIDQVWGEEAPPKPLASLRAYVANLRRVLGAGALVRVGSGYRVDTAGDVVDAREFARLVDSGRRLLDSGELAAARTALEDGLELWHDTPLAEFRNLDFAIPETHRLEAMRAEAVELYFEAALRLGDSSSVVDRLASELTANPMRERLCGQLMLAQYRCGRRTDALLTYTRISEVLDAELGVRPGSALERLATDIRNESPALDWQPTVVVEKVSVPERRAGDLHGRTSEIRRIRAALTAAAEGRGGVVILSGDSGMGKTTLAQHVTELADELGLATVWAGHAAELRRPPSWAWAHALRGLAGQLPSGGGPLHAALPDWWGVATEDVGAETRSAPGFDVIEATTAALAELTFKRPALVVLDDLQRADRFTVEVLEHLASTGRRVPMLVVATWQEGGADGASSARAFERLRSRTDIDVIKLRGLSSEATADVIADTCGAEPPPEFVGVVHARTGGNPFYVRELVRLLDDSGRLGTLDAGIDDDDVPEAVSGIIRERMSRLPESSRTLLYAAAVAGTEFVVSRLAAAMRRSIDETAAALLPAQQAGLIVDVPRQRGSLRFSHGLVRDAVAAEMTGVGRARLHADIALAYWQEPGEVPSQDAIDGAEHAWRAGSELDADTALRLLDRARADAWGRSAYREVAELDRRALEVCARLPSDTERFDVQVDLQLQLASCEAVVNGQSSAKTLMELRRTAPDGKDAVQETTAVAMGCLEACGTGRYHDATVLSDSLVEFFAATDDPIAGSAGYYIRGLTEFMRGNLDLAEAAISTLHSAVPPVDHETFGALASFEVLAYAVAAHSTGLRGNVDGAAAVLSEGLAEARRRNDAFGTAVLRTADLQLSAMTGVADGVAERAAHVVAQLTELGIDQFIGGARLIRAWACAVGPDGVDTVDELHAAFEQHGQGGRRIFSPLYCGLLADATAVHRDLADAQAALTRADAIAAATGEHVWNAQLAARRLRLAARQRAKRG